LVPSTSHNTAIFRTQSHPFDPRILLDSPAGKAPQVSGQERNWVLDFTKRYNLEYRDGNETRSLPGSGISYLDESRR